MKNYIAPEMEITKFAAEDIMTTSNQDPSQIIATASADVSADSEIKFSNNRGEF